MKNVKIILGQTSSHATIEVDGVPVKDVVDVEIHAAVGSLTRVRLTVLAKRVELEGLAEVVTEPQGTCGTCGFRPCACDQQ